MKSSVITALFLTFAALTSARNIQWHLRNSDEVDCTLVENQVTLHPHPASCSLYLQCDNGEVVERPCPPCTKFSPYQGICVHAYLSDCTAEDPNDDTDEKVSSNEVGEEEAPEDRGSEGDASTDEDNEELDIAGSGETPEGESTQGTSEAPLGTSTARFITIEDESPTAPDVESTTAESESELSAETPEDTSTAAPKGDAPTAASEEPTTAGSESESPTEETEDNSTTGSERSTPTGASEEPITAESESEPPAKAPEDTSPATPAEVPPTATPEEDSSSVPPVESSTPSSEDSFTSLTSEEGTGVAEVDIPSIEGGYFSQMICANDSFIPSSSAIPHPSNCTQYYACAAGVATLKSCAIGRRFESASGTCVKGACA